MRAEQAEWLTTQADASGDLQLKAILWPRVAGQSSTSPPRLPFTIYASQWHDILSGMNLSHRVSLSLEIPAPAKEMRRLHKVVAALERAQTELRTGRSPRKVMAAVRESLEALRDALEDKDEVNNASFELRDKPVQDRLWTVRKALWMLAGAAPHAGDAEDKTPYELPEARAALAMAVAVATAYVDRTA